MLYKGRFMIFFRRCYFILYSIFLLPSIAFSGPFHNSVEEVKQSIKEAKKSVQSYKACYSDCEAIRKIYISRVASLDADWEGTDFITDNDTVKKDFLSIPPLGDKARITGHIDGGSYSLHPKSNEAILKSTIVRFQWENVGASQYRLHIGTNKGQKNLHDSGLLVGITTNKIENLPINGSKVYVRIFTNVNKKWEYNDYIYTSYSKNNMGKSNISKSPNSETKSNSEKCKKYAKKAIFQNSIAINNNCNFTGGRWHNNFNHHYNWCLGLPLNSTFPNRENSAREVNIKNCIITSSKNDNKNNSEKCKIYAKNAIFQNSLAINNNCNFIGNRWHNNFNKHYSWCSGLPLNSTFPSRENNAREVSIKSCIIKKEQIPSKQINQVIDIMNIFK